MTTDNVTEFQRRLVNEWPKFVYLADFGDGDGCRPRAFIQHPDDTTPQYARGDLYEAQAARIRELEAENAALRDGQAPTPVSVGESARFAETHARLTTEELQSIFGARIPMRFVEIMTSRSHTDALGLRRALNRALADKETTAERLGEVMT